MRISIVGPVYPYRGGIAHYTTLLTETLLQLGHETQVVSFRRQYPGWLYPGKSDKDPSNKKPLSVAEFMLDPFNPITWIKTAQNIEVFNPDLVILQWWTPYWAPTYGILTRLLKKRVRKTVYLVHNVLPHERHFYDWFLTRWAFAAVDTYLVQTLQEEKRLRGLTPRSEIILHPHPLYLPAGGEVVSKDDARLKLGLPLDAKTLLFFGIVRPYKGLHVLIEALGILKQRIQLPQVIVAGEVWGQEDYTSQIAALGLEDSVRMDNRYIPDELVPLYFSAADMFAAPYLHATQSGAVKLALGYSLPVILSEPAATDAGMHNNSGIKIVPVDDPPALAEAIEQWLNGTWHPSPMLLDEARWESLAEMVLQLARPAV